jgi:hypothetical protein
MRCGGKANKTIATITKKNTARRTKSAMIFGIGGDDGVRTRDLRRDRPAF